MTELKKSQFIAFAFILIGIAITVGLSVANADAYKILAVFAVLVIAPLFLLKPELGFLALIVARPIIDILGQQVNFNLRDVVTINLSAVVGILLVLWGSLYLLYKRARVFRLPVFYPLIVLSLLSLVSIASSEFKLTVFGEWVRVSSFVVIFLLGYHFIQSYHKFRTLSSAVLLSAFVPVTLGLHQLITGTGISDEASSNRILSTFAHPSLFGQYLAALMVLLLILALLFSRYAGIYATIYGMLGLVMLFTFSRGAWGFALIGSVLLLLTFYRKHLHRVLLFGILVLLGISAFGVLLQSYTSFKPIESSLISRITQTTQFNPDSSIYWRFCFWQESIAESKPYLVRGYGAGTFLEFAEQEVESSFDAHNDFLKLGIEIGIPGLVALVSLFAILLAQGIKAYAKNTSLNERVLAMFIVAEVSGMIFVSFFDNLYQNTTFYWIILALFGGSLRLLNSSKHSVKD